LTAKVIANILITIDAEQRQDCGDCAVHDVVELLAALVAIDSVNPSLEKGAGGEARLARFAADWLARAGLSVRLEEALAGRPNLIARLDGRPGGSTLMWNAHLDTVGVHGMDRPFEPRLEGGRLHGRGAADTKAGLAAMMWAAASLARARDFAGSLVLCGVIDEEYLSAGTEATLRELRADGCIVAEDTALRIGTAHQGFGWYEIETRGRAAHGMHPEEGIDAIALMGEVLADLAQFERDVLARDVHPLAGRAVFHTGTIHGGSELGIYPERCVLGIEIGCNPGMAMAERRHQIEALLGARGQENPAFRANLRVVVEREAFAVAPDARIVRSLERAVADAGRDPAPWGMNAWMDAALVQAAGIPTVVFGPGGHGHHTADEWVEVAQVERAAALYEASARRFLAAG
jgi:acetylornithine deacetylase